MSDKRKYKVKTTKRKTVTKEKKPATMLLYKGYSMPAISATEKTKTVLKSPTKKRGEKQKVKNVIKAKHNPTGKKQTTVAKSKKKGEWAKVKTRKGKNFVAKTRKAIAANIRKGR